MTTCLHQEDRFSTHGYAVCRRGEPRPHCGHFRLLSTVIGCPRRGCFSARLKEVDNDLVRRCFRYTCSAKGSCLQATIAQIHYREGMRCVEFDRENWLLSYESARHGFLTSTKSLVKANPLFNAMLASGVSFYQAPISSYSYVVAPGCAPQWIIQSWLKEAQKQPPRKTDDLPKDHLRRVIEASLLTKEGRKVSSSEFRTFLRLHDLKHNPEPVVEDGSYT